MTHAAGDEGLNDRSITMRTSIQFRLPVTAAALALLLAACGGGGGGAQRGVLSSPQPPSSSGGGLIPGGGQSGQAGQNGQNGNTSQNGQSGQNGNASQSGQTGQSGNASQGGQTGQNGNTGQNGASGSGGTGDSGAGGTGSGGNTGGQTGGSGTGNAGTGNTGNESGGSSAGNQNGGASGTGTITPIVSRLPLISARGVRGDVLLAMIDQRACASLSRATSYNGSLLANTHTPNVVAGVELDPFNYTHTTSAPDPSSPLIDAKCMENYYRYRAAEEGRSYTIYAYSYPRYYHPLSIGATQRVHYLEVRTPLTVSGTGFTLGQTISVRDGADDGISNFWGNGTHVEKLELSAAAARTIAFNSVVPYGVLIEWKGTSSSAAVSATSGSGAANATGTANAASGTSRTNSTSPRLEQLMLLRGQNGSQAKLCWNASGLQYARRLHCTAWKAPAGWQRGQKLGFDGHYLIDDRSAHAGESGFFYWR
ncbi:MAG: hypothetical protein D8H96_00935 [Lautropia sp.]|nr:MAG: hypothetical protein D8H96_00935 [Lautropia sp.]